MFVSLIAPQLFGVIAAQAASGEPPTITITENDSGYRVEIGAFPASEEAAIEEEVTRRAEKLCNPKEIRWGKFGSSVKLDRNPGLVPPRVRGYFREFSCVIREAASHDALPANWQPSPKDEADVRQVFESYYAQRDAGEFQSAAAMFEPGVQQEKPTSEAQHEFNRKLGAGRRRVTGITWYVNRPDAPRPGAYIALDFVGEYPKLHVYCGYLMLYRRGAGRYEITREEQNIFERGAGSTDMAQVEAMRAATCRGN